MDKDKGFSTAALRVLWDPSEVELYQLEQLLESPGWVVAHKLLRSLLEQQQENVLHAEDLVHIARGQGAFNVLVLYQNEIVDAVRRWNDVKEAKTHE